MGFFELFAPVKFSKNPSTFKFSSSAKIVSLWLIVLVSVIFLFSVRHILPVFIWAIITAYIFNPLISFFQEKTKIHRIIWILILYLFFGILIFLTLNKLLPVISNELSDLAINSPAQSDTFLGKIASQGSISIFGAEINMKDQVNIFYGWIRTQIPSHAVTIFFSAVERIVYALIYFIITFYLLLDAGKFFGLFEEMIPHPYRVEISDLLSRMNLTLGAYIRAQIILIFIMSAATFMVLSLLKIKYALLISIISGILEVIPIVGPICATTIAATVALLQSPVPFGFTNSFLAILVICAYFILRQLEDYLVIPNVASRFVRVHPIVGIFALLVGGLSGGVLGLFLAIPTAAILKIFVGYIHQKLVED